MTTTIQTGPADQSDLPATTRPQPRTAPARTSPTRTDRLVPVDCGGLRPVVDRPPLDVYLHLLWQRRHFVWADARARTLSESRRFLLGQIWLVLRPVMDAAVYLVIFGLVMHASRGIENFLGYLIVGVFLFRFTSGAINAGSRSIISGRALVRSFSFPRIALPVADIARQVLRFVPTLSTMLVLILLIPPGSRPTWRWLLLPLVLTLQVVLVTGLVLIASRLVARVPDLSQVIALATRFWFYGSGVMFSFEQRFGDNPTVMTVVELNPMYQVLDIARDCLLYAQTPSLASWGILAGWAVVALAGGLVFFWRGEESYGAA
ncbi:MAG: ABC transporter permease [Cellulomonas sp.]|jgi:teichoic acid transport system permease protein|nr:ABC transporter permease [Cellulomonas sp.]